TAARALAIQDSNLDFGHVQPTGVLWSVVEFQSRQKSRCGFQPQDFLEAGAEMGVQVVQNQMDFARLGVDVQRQELHKGHKVRLGPPTSQDRKSTRLNSSHV